MAAERAGRLPVALGVLLVCVGVGVVLVQPLPSVASASVDPSYVVRPKFGGEANVTVV